MRLNGIKTHEPQRLFSLRFAFYSLASVSSPTVGSASGSLSGSLSGSIGVGAAAVGAVVVGAGAVVVGAGAVVGGAGAVVVGTGAVVVGVGAVVGGAGAAVVSAGAVVVGVGAVVSGGAAVVGSVVSGSSLSAGGSDSSCVTVPITEISAPDTIVFSFVLTAQLPHLETNSTSELPVVFIVKVKLPTAVICSV